MKKFWNRRTSWSVKDLGLLKTCMLSAGISLGIYFATYLHNLLPFFILLSAITAISVFFLWRLKIKSQTK